MKIDKSFQQSPQQPKEIVKQNPLENEVKIPQVTNEQLLKEKEELLKKLEEKEEQIKRLEQKTQNTQNFLENTVKILSQKSILLKESEEKLKNSKLPLENPNSQEMNNLKSELFLSNETITDLKKKLSQVTVFQKVVENISLLSHSEHLLSTLVKEENFSENEKISKITKILTEKSSLKENEIKITLSNFQTEDIVLFIRDTHGNWEIFNRNQSGYYLSLEIVDQLKKKQEYKDLISVVGQILFIEQEQTALKNNPYGFAVGRKYNVVHIYPFQ